MLERAKTIWLSDDGVEAVEVAMVMALVAVVCIGAYTTLGQKADDNITYAANKLPSGPTS